MRALLCGPSSLLHEPLISSPLRGWAALSLPFASEGETAASHDLPERFMKLSVEKTAAVSLPATASTCPLTGARCLARAGWPMRGTSMPGRRMWTATRARRWLGAAAEWAAATVVAAAAAGVVGAWPRSIVGRTGIDAVMPAANSHGWSVDLFCRRQPRERRIVLPRYSSSMKTKQAQSSRISDISTTLIQNRSFKRSKI